MMRLFGVQLRKELIELWRTRKLVIVLAVLVGFGLMSPVLAKLTPDLIESMGEDQLSGMQIIVPEPTRHDATSQFVTNMTQFGLLLAVLMSFAAIVGERERGQAALIFPHPLPRPVFVLAKFAALAILFGLGLLLGAVADYIYTVLLFEAPDVGRFLAMVVLVYLWLLSLVALSLLASTLGRSTTTAGGIAFLFLIVFLVLGSFASFAPSKITDWGLALATERSAPERWLALAVTVVITAGSLIASGLILQRQEID